MKYFIIVIGFFLGSCENKHKNIQEEAILTEKTNNEDSLLYSVEGAYWETTGVYSKYNKILLICEYHRTTPMLPLSDSLLNLFVKTRIIPEYGLKIVPGYQAPNKFIPPEKINYLSKKSTETPVTYYEIVEAPSLQPYHKLHKTVGKLYRFFGQHGSNFYISDTTEKYGSFVIITPPFIKPPAYALDAPKKLSISSIDERSKSLIGEYDKFSEIPYRIIRDEEVANSKK
jgi:hypothetical protein